MFDQAGEGLIPASALVELLQRAGISVDPGEVFRTYADTIATS